MKESFPDWISEITETDFPEGRIRDVAVVCGVSDAVSLIFGVPGLRLYIPVYGNKKEIVDYITTQYNGKNRLTIIGHLKINLKRFEYVLKGRYKFDKKSFLSNKYMQLVADKCGPDIARRLIKNFSGTFIYIPRISGLVEIKRNMILKEFNGSNSSELAIKYGFTERYINKIISDSYISTKKRVVLDSVQTDIFEKTA